MQSEQLVGTNTSDKHMSYPVFKQFSKHILNVRAPYCFLVSWAFGIQSFVETMVFDYHSGSNIFRGTTLQYSDESTMQLRRRQTLFKMIKFQQKKPCSPEATVLTAVSVLSVFSEFHSSPNSLIIECEPLG